MTISVLRCIQSGLLSPSATYSTGSVAAGNVLIVGATAYNSGGETPPYMWPLLDGSIASSADANVFNNASTTATLSSEVDVWSFGSTGSHTLSFHGGAGPPANISFVVMELTGALTTLDGFGSTIASTTGSSVTYHQYNTNSIIIAYGAALSGSLTVGSGFTQTSPSSAPDMMQVLIGGPVGNTTVAMSGAGVFTGLGLRYNPSYSPPQLWTNFNNTYEVP